ncbi:hypothetical protein ABOM_004694 [Aspergillus bombycis]|uniref:AhpC/TSA antioxidant enzyme-domain-containing protein n=1 Tax=Aspergillus bombycis TaxID=109264 RepID=A0A1F8A4E4_9EURO|nr:hypothetical protein ABOM_004694 [Aspergillus bombycis]OGM46584.1 hypothetical protein ABOM_004694 [Aspergillus bombycis]
MAQTTIIRPPDDIPTGKALSEAYELELQSETGHPVRFGELIAAKGDHITTIVIFIRHFFCAYDQDYVHSISQRLTESVLSTLPNSAGPAQVIIIGCGQPAAIVPYVAETSAAFPIYTDPKGKIYEKLHMKRTVSAITRPPTYTQRSFISALGTTFKQMFRSGLQALSGGGWGQNGGEWVFKNGKCVYVHRMQNVSDHLTADELLQVISQGT